MITSNRSEQSIPDYAMIQTAIQTKSAEELASLLKETKADVNHADSDGTTLLHCAAQYGNLENLKLLIKLGARHRANKLGSFPIHRAAQWGHSHIIHYLVQERKISVNLCEKRKTANFPADSLLHIATQYKQLETVKQLIALGAKYRSNNNGDYPIHYAAIGGHANLIHYFLSDEKLQVPSGERGRNGITPLHLAAKHGHLEVAKIVCPVEEKKEEEEKETVHYADDSGYFPIHYAARYGQTHLIDFFVAVIKIDVDLEAKRVTWEGPISSTPLHEASNSREEHLETVRHLIALGATHHASMQGTFPIHLATANGHQRVLEFYLDEMKQDVNMETNDGDTLLHMAARSGKLDIVCMLEKRGVTYRANKQGRFPLHDAAELNHPSLIRFFVKKMQADVNVNYYCANPNYSWAVDEKITPLSLAVEKQSNEAIQELIRLKSKVTDECFKQELPLETFALLLAETTDNYIIKKMKYFMSHFHLRTKTPKERQAFLICVLAQMEDAQKGWEKFQACLKELYTISTPSVATFLRENPETLLKDACMQREYRLMRNKDNSEITNVVKSCKALNTTFRVSKVFGFSRLPVAINDHILQFLMPPKTRTLPCTLFAASKPSPEKFHRLIARQAHFFHKLTEIKFAPMSDAPRKKKRRLNKS